ncbi:MAG: globin [Caulobacterales bacterium]|jgi:hemoglobin-like flavoprotein|nr:globin [Caulobacterales bacterium]
MINAAEAALITQSLEIASERGGDLTGAVYARLFAERPDLEPLFVMDADGAVRGEMLSRVFDAILDFIGDRAYAHNLIHAEASNHDGYNVPRDVFALFFTTVADTVQEACGGAWSTDMSQAWKRLLNALDHYIAA